jgi:hypothetical protein
MAMNRENDILNLTRFLLQNIKNYTDNRIDEAAEDAVKRVIKKQIKNCLKAVIVAAFAIFLLLGYISLIFVSIHIANSDAPMSIRVHLVVVAFTWAIMSSLIIVKIIDSKE